MRKHAFRSVGSLDVCDVCGKSFSASDHFENHHSVEAMKSQEVSTAPDILGVREDRGWIQTFTGRQFWPLSPRAKDVCIQDIAHALAMKCRYTGHCKQFYSVAQHSVLASLMAKSGEVMLSKWLLMHDATEAYLPDVARPVKQQLHGFREIEDNLMNVIAGVFELDMPMPTFVKHADLVLLATERRDLMSPPPIPWMSTENISPLPAIINGVRPELASAMFLHRFNHLFNAGPAVWDGPRS